MEVEFFNIKKAKVPFLINLKDENYLSGLSKDSKRHYNKSQRNCKNNFNIDFSKRIHTDIDYKILTYHFRFDFKSQIQLSKSDNVFYLKITNNNGVIIAYNIYYETDSPHGKYIYSMCPYFLEKDYDLNNFLWFESIDFFRKNGFHYLDIEFEYDLKLKNKIKYNIDELVTFQYIINNRKKENSFGDENSSKFLFLSEIEKKQTNSFYLMSVCECGQKNLINVIEENICFNCKSRINIIYD
jgi:hypothetical protein